MPLIFRQITFILWKLAQSFLALFDPILLETLKRALRSKSRTSLYLFRNNDWIQLKDNIQTSYNFQASYLAFFWLKVFKVRVKKPRKLSKVHSWSNWNSYLRCFCAYLSRNFKQYTVMWTDYRFYCSKLCFFFQRHKLENLKQMLTWGICFRM